MRAVLVNSLRSGGAEKIVIHIASYLEKTNENFLLIVLNKVSDEYDIAGLNVHYIAEGKNLDRGFSLKKLFIFPYILIKLILLIRKERIDLIQSHLFSSDVLNVLAKRLGGRHKVQIVNHSLISYEKTQGVLGNFKLFFLGFIYRSADLIISISKMMKVDIETQLLHDKKKNHIVIPNPHNIYDIVLKRKDPVIDFNFDRNKRYLITCGRLDKRKRFDLLIEAFSVIKHKYKDTELLILGDGPEIDLLKDVAIKNHCSSSVHFLGFVSNPFKYISKSDIFLLTSDTEGLPNSLIEAMICETPLIASDCPTGPREIIAPSTDCNIKIQEGIEVCDYGILFAVGKKDCLVEAIGKMINNPELFRLKTKDAFSYVRKYDKTRILNMYKQVIFDN